MKPEEILPDISSEAVIRIGEDEICLTLAQFREIVTAATTSMKISYIQSLIEQDYLCLVDDFTKHDRLLLDGRLISHDDKQYECEDGKPFRISDFQWFNSGEDCKILQPGEKWQDGALRLRITAEFVPKESSTDRPIENPLDTFRENS
jgi:hypothetical protein